MSKNLLWLRRKAFLIHRQLLGVQCAYESATDGITEASILYAVKVLYDRDHKRTFPVSFLRILITLATLVRRHRSGERYHESLAGARRVA